MFEHEQVVISRGARSALPIIIAVHSTTLGPAAGGVRMWHYPAWQGGLEDALRLSAAMTVKCAVAGLPYGGGKTVVAVPERLDPGERRAVLLDVGDCVESLDGSYATGPDVGTSPHDMTTIAERTSHVCCQPESAGGSGDSSPHTAAGARLTVADVDPTRRTAAEALGATWTTPDEALTAPVDILVPAALGGILTTAVVPTLRCAAIAGPANNQLADESVADDLARRGICWTPDYVVSAGGVIYAITRELQGLDADTATARVWAIGDTVSTILITADRDGVTPHRAAQRLAAQRRHDGSESHATSVR